MTSADPADITIIGGGPTGLFASFYAGMRGASVRIIDSLPELGGQLMALYPEKYIYDVGGLPRILAKDLARSMEEQGLQFGAEVRLEEEVLSLESAPDGFTLTTTGGVYPTRAVIIAGGKGAFAPRHLGCPGYHELLGKGVAYHVRDPETYRGRKILIVGGGDSALDWTLGLLDVAEELTLIHRREGFRAHRASVRRMEDAVGGGRMVLRTFHELRAVHGTGSVEGATIFDNRSDEDTRLEVDAVVALLGFKPDLGPIGEWGLDLERNSIKVDQHMETNVAGIFAAGDIAYYEGKLELIATGYAEAATAVNYAVHHYDPTSRIAAGHSTNLKVFKEREAEEERREIEAEEAAAAG
ncbi:MAG: NAD(P)/FAD-dependent oxidoreductase [Gemmatimonadota bacterium]